MKSRLVLVLFWFLYLTIPVCLAAQASAPRKDAGRGAELRIPLRPDDRAAARVWKSPLTLDGFFYETASGVS